MTMNEQTKVNTRNYLLSCIIQALVGALTENINRVSFNWEGSHLILRFNLNVDDSSDLEEIDDVIFELEALLAGEYKIKYKVKIGDLDDLDENEQIVFKMKN